jgi:pimeloyl-ACP methyl ester carboxylesterase
VRRVVAFLLCSVALATACASTDDASSAPTSTVERVPTTEAGAAPSTAADAPAARQCPDGGAEPVGSYAVGRSERTAVDPSRPTTPRPEWADRAAPDRTLPYVVLYPADGRPEAGGTGIAEVAGSGDGPFPVVMWSHGMGSAGTERNDTLARWASAGYVVVAPTFPLSSRAPDASDLLNQPGDVAFVLDAVRTASATDGDVLDGLVRVDCVALAGHSMGGGTTLAAAYDPGTADIAPRAIVDIAGLLPTEAGGRSIDEMAPLPALVVHGTDDRTVPYRVGEEAVRVLHGPTWFLTFPGGGHSNVFAPPRAEVLDRAVVAFLDGQLKAAPAALDALPSELAASGVATLVALPAR